MPAIKIAANSMVCGRFAVARSIDRAEAFLTEFRHGSVRGAHQNRSLCQCAAPIRCITLHRHRTGRASRAAASGSGSIDPDGYGVEIVSGIESRCPRCQSCGKPSIRAQGVRATAVPPATATRRVPRQAHRTWCRHDKRPGARALGSAFLAIKTAETYTLSTQQVLNVLRGWPRIVCCVSVSVRAGLSLEVSNSRLRNDVSKNIRSSKVRSCNRASIPIGWAFRICWRDHARCGWAGANDRSAQPPW